MLVKDREEHINVTFDFWPMVAALGIVDTVQNYAAEDYFAGDYVLEVQPASIIAPTIEVSRDFGDSALLAPLGPTITGLKVIQSITGGTRDSVYDVACTAQFSNGELRRLSTTLAVN